MAVNTYSYESLTGRVSQIPIERDCYINIIYFHNILDINIYC